MMLSIKYDLECSAFDEYIVFHPSGPQRIRVFHDVTFIGNPGQLFEIETKEEMRVV